MFFYCIKQDILNEKLILLLKLQNIPCIVYFIRIGCIRPEFIQNGGMKSGRE